MSSTQKQDFSPGIARPSDSNASVAPTLTSDASPRTSGAAPSVADSATYTASTDEHSPLPSARTTIERRPTLNKSEVVYFVDHSTTAIAYAEGHVMRPSRVRALHALVHSLGLDRDMTVCQAKPATIEEMSGFHRGAYLECLRQAPEICANPLNEVALSFQKEFAVPFASQASDCPLFPDVWALVSQQAGASLACAEALVCGEARIAMNWAGGMHHAAAAYASGFCFVNDIVLCIQRLLHRFQRVLYVDLDVHHGDGVERAFAGNCRVMTVSLHQFGNGFFPRTGDYATPEAASAFAVNVPLPPCTGDAAYLLSFRTVLSSVMRCFDPDAVVLQCGADTIAGDTLGRLCVTTVAHNQCVSDVLALGLPTVLLGGGGYHVFHTAKCWALHTAAAVGRTATQLPYYVPREDPYYWEYRRECVPKRPTLHVFLDPDADRPLPMKESLIHWRYLCQSIEHQMRAARLVRQRFLRTVSAAKTYHALLLAKKEAMRRKREKLGHADASKRSRLESKED